MTALSSSEFYSVVEPLVRQVGLFQKAQLQSGQYAIEYKGAINLVTEVDKESERQLIAGITQAFPDHDIMAEEGTGERKDSPYKWIIDPLDGTTNFAHGYPVFAVSVGLEYRGDILAGVVFDPMRDEFFKSYKGGGAFLNDRPIQVSKVDDLKRAMMGTGFAYNIQQTDDDNTRQFRNMLKVAQAVRRDGAAAIDLCYVACGRFDGFWEMNLFPWDTAAGKIILTEAGGKLSRFDGGAYTVYDKEIVATNGLIHDEALRIIKASSVKHATS